MSDTDTKDGGGADAPPSSSRPMTWQKEEHEGPCEVFVDVLVHDIKVESFADDERHGTARRSKPPRRCLVSDAGARPVRAACLPSLDLCDGRYLRRAMSAPEGFSPVSILWLALEPACVSNPHTSNAPYTYSSHLLSSKIDTKLERAWFYLYLRLTWVDPVLANALLDRTHRATGKRSHVGRWDRS